MNSQRIALWLVLAPSILFAGLLLGPAELMRNGIFEEFGLSRDTLSQNFSWTLLTYAFLHGSIWHAIFNLLGLWVLGKHICDEYGGSVFIGIFGVGVIAGGLIQIATSDDSILIGNSGGILALLTASGFLWNDRRIGFGFGSWSFGHLQGKYLGWGTLISALIFAAIVPWLPESARNIGHACHAGGAVAGAILVWAAWLMAPLKEENFHRR